MRDAHLTEADLPGCVTIAPLLVVLVCLALALVTLPGCGPSALRIHAQMANAAHDAMESDAIERACDAATRTCEDEGCLDVVEARCEAAAEAHDALILPVELYRAGVLQAAAGGELDPTLALPVVGAWPAFIETLRLIGVTIPSLESP